MDFHRQHLAKNVSENSFGHPLKNETPYKRIYRISHFFPGKYAYVGRAESLRSIKKHPHVHYVHCGRISSLVLTPGDYINRWV